MNKAVVQYADAIGEFSLVYDAPGHSLGPEEVVYGDIESDTSGYCPVNDWYSLVNCSSDFVHPTTRGHGQLLQSVLTRATRTYNQSQQAL